MADSTHEAINTPHHEQIEEEVISDERIARLGSFETIQGNQIGEVISDETSPSFDKFKFKAFYDKYVSPSSIVGIRTDNGNLLIGRIINSHESNPYSTANRVAVKHVLNMKSEYPTEKLSFSVYRTYEVEVMEQIIGDRTPYTITKPTLLPTSGLPVIIPRSEIIKEVLGLTEVENGIHLGNLASNISSEGEIPVTINRDTIQRHYFIGGMTGSGKSYAAKVLSEEIHRFRIPIIFFDTQREFIPLTNQLRGRVIVPGSRNPRIGYTIRLSQLTESEIFEMVPTVKSDNQEAVLARAFLDLRDENRDFDLQDLINQILAQAPNIANAATCNTVARRVSSYLGSYNFIGAGFNWHQTIIPDSVIDIDCSNFTTSKAQLILAATMRELENLRRNRSICPFMIVIDEAHLFAPQDDKSSAKQVIREAVRIGRHHGICVMLVTQSPIDIDKKVIRQCNTRLIFAMDGDQLQSLQGIQADATEDILNNLPKSPRGTCILSGTYETVKHAMPVEVRLMNTDNADGGQAPNIFNIAGNWVVDNSNQI